MLSFWRSGQPASRDTFSMRKATRADCCICHDSGKYKLSCRQLTSSPMAGHVSAYIPVSYPHPLRKTGPASCGVILGWSHIKCCFMQAWPADHMPKRGRRWLGRRPLVHKGFWRSWSAQSVGDRVVMFLAQLLADSKLAPADWHVYITGAPIPTQIPSSDITLDAVCMQCIAWHYSCSLVHYVIIYTP
jgi:hypothetical protein